MVAGGLVMSEAGGEASSAAYTNKRRRCPGNGARAVAVGGARRGCPFASPQPTSPQPGPAAGSGAKRSRIGEKPAPCLLWGRPGAWAGPPAGLEAAGPPPGPSRTVAGRLPSGLGSCRGARREGRGAGSAWAFGFGCINLGSSFSSEVSDNSAGSEVDQVSRDS